MDNTDKCYEDLANAVITQAIDDYVRAHKERHGKRHHLDEQEKRILEAKMAGVIKFLHSEWYQALTTVPCETIEKAIKMRCRGLLRKRNDPTVNKRKKDE